MSSAEQTNPHFNHAERAPYELGYLLKKLPANFSLLSTAAPDQILMAEAAIDHAGYATDILTNGLEGLGQALFVGGANGQFEISPANLSSIGSLISHLAAEMQFLQETKDNLRSALHERALKLAGSTSKGARS